MRLEGATFSLTCERILFARGSRRVEIEGVRGLRLDPGLKRKLPPVSLRTERLELEVDDLGLDEPWEVVFSHPGGIRASLDGARVRVGTLVLQLRP
jgi:hypothetical protein